MDMAKSGDKQYMSPLIAALVASASFTPLLRGAGIFIKNYASGEVLTNSIWRDLGYGEEEMRGENWKSYVHPDDQGLTEEFEQRLLSGGADAWAGNFRLIASDGQVHWIRHKALVLERAPGGLPTLYVGWDQDVSDYAAMVETERERRKEAYERFMRAEAIRTAGVILSSELDPEKTADRVLAQAGKVLDFESAAIWTLRSSELVRLAKAGPETRSTGKRPRKRLLHLAANAPCPAPIARETKSRALLEVPLVVRGALVGLLEFSRERRKPFRQEDKSVALIFADHAVVALSNALVHNATELEASTDWLTGLLTRRAFINQAGRLRTEHRGGEPFSLLMIDVDHFKNVNDRFGHGVGDQALKLIADIVRGALRSVDLCSRYGGEELTVLLPGASAHTALPIAERIRERIAEARLDAAPEATLTVSIGVADSLTAGPALQDVIDRADVALYAAKESGRNRCVLDEGPS